MEEGMDRLMYVSRNIMSFPFTSSRSTRRKERLAMMNYHVILRSARFTDLQE